MSPTQMEALDFRYLLLEYYKKLHISENELAVLLMIDHLLGQKNTFITPDLLVIKMGLPMKEIDKIYVDLMNKNFVVVETGKKLKTSLKPLKKRLYDLFETSLTIEHQNRVDEEKSQALSEIRQTFETELKRVLLPLEISCIAEWVELKFTKDEVIGAMREALAKGQSTFRHIDKILLSYKAKKDLEKHGATGVDNDWDKDIEKAMEIAKVKWIKE